MAAFDPIQQLLQEKDARLQEKDARLREITQEKDARIKELIESRQREIDGKETLIKDLYNRLARIEFELKEKLAEYRTILINRSVLEFIAAQYNNNPRLNVTQIYEQVVKPKILDQNDKLKISWAGPKLAMLEGQQQIARIQQGVEKELADLWHTASAKVHNLPAGHGLVIGGELPFRAALALVVMKAQEETMIHSEFIYVDENGRRICGCGANAAAQNNTAHECVISGGRFVTL